MDYVVGDDKPSPGAVILIRPAGEFHSIVVAKKY
jgi:hypothetical protein